MDVFSFREDLCSGKLVTYADIKYEQACILYNIGALHSILGAMDNRQSPDVSIMVNELNKLMVVLKVSRSKDLEFIHTCQCNSHS